MRAALAAVLVFCAGPLSAQEERVPEEIRACASIRAKSERLACFDRAVAYLMAGKTAEASSAPPSAEAMFGMKASTPAAVHTEEKVERKQVEAINAKVSKLSFGADGAILELDNGQTWSQISGSGTLLLKVGDEIKITRGALNSFNMKTPSGRIAKVKRLQ